MYSTCLFCTKDLGTNEVIETLPIGRRLAFDASQGRLWVVCRHCAKWNLVPFESRLESIDACERLFRDTPTRYSTDNIGLARVKEGLELVRIGPAQRPEFAGWRYGDQFRRRRRRNLLIGVGGAALVGGAVLAPGLSGGRRGGVTDGIDAGQGAGSVIGMTREKLGSDFSAPNRFPRPPSFPDVQVSLRQGEPKTRTNRMSDSIRPLAGHLRRHSPTPAAGPAAASCPRKSPHPS